MVEFDEFGPEKILEFYHPKLGMHGFLVLDSTALGPAKGGTRMTPTVSIDEVARLARAMTWKNALAGLPFGGGKAGIIADDRQLTKQQKKEMIEAFAEAISTVSPELYITAPDMNMAEEEMGWIAKINGKKSVTGKPKKLGGLPHELGSTGFGVAHAAIIAARFSSLDIKNTAIAIEGFGNVGWFAAKYLTEAGAKLVAVSDSRGCAYKKEGLSFDKLKKVKKEKGTVTEYPGSKNKSCPDIIGADVDILITAAIPDLIKAGDVDRVKAKIIVEGSNIPMTPDVEKLFHKKKVLVIPDFVANAGGVISSYAEYKGWSQKTMFRLVEEKIKHNTNEVLQGALKKNLPPREVALEIAQKRVRKFCKVCSV